MPAKTDLIDRSSCLCGEDYPENVQTNPRCVEHNRARDYYLRRTYGITLPEYWAIFDHQGGVCAVCKKPPRNGILLSVDHDHVDNYVRGLLHAWCNHKVVGRHRDWMLLQKAADYLRNPPALAVLGSGRKCPKKTRNTKRNPKRKRR